MKTKYSVKLLCELLDVSRSGYYKWLKRKDTPNRYEQDRAILTELLQDAHEKHPSYGYHRLAQAVRNETGWLFSHNINAVNTQGSIHWPESIVSIASLEKKVLNFLTLLEADGMSADHMN